MILFLIGVAIGHQFAGFVEDFRRALALAGVPLKAAAIEMGIDQGQLTRQLAGDGHLSIARISRIESPTFWQWLWLMQSQRHGVPAEVASAITHQRQMLRMDLSVPGREESA